MIRRCRLPQSIFEYDLCNMDEPKNAKEGEKQKTYHMHEESSSHEFRLLCPGPNRALERLLGEVAEGESRQQSAHCPGHIQHITLSRYIYRPLTNNVPLQLKHAQSNEAPINLSKHSLRCVPSSVLSIHNLKKQEKKNHNSKLSEALTDRFYRAPDQLVSITN